MLLSLSLSSELLADIADSVSLASLLFIG